MSRRKQAKPRAVKRGDLEDEDEAGGVVSMATEAGRDATTKSLGSDCGPSTPTSRSSDPGVTSGDPDRDMTLTSDVTMEEEEEEEGEEELEEGVEEEIEEEYRCETCNGLFYSLLEFMDHRNYECATGDSAQGGPRSSCSRESCSSSPFSSATGSPGSPYLTPVDLLPCSDNGVDADHPFGCNYCNKAYTKSSHLRRHEQFHSDILPHKCDMCPRVFKHKRSRERHQRMHLINHKYTCPTCGSKFKRLEILRNHMRTHKEAEDQGQECPVCHVTFATDAALSSHMRTHKNGTTSEVNSLKRKAEKRVPDDYHSMSKARAIQCPYCAEIILGKQSLEFHFEHSHPGKKYKCPVCNAGYSVTDDLFNHLKTQHDYPAEIDSPPNELKNDDNNYIMQSYAKHDCPFCDKGGFSSADVLEIHVRTLHCDKLSQLNICTYCNAIYQSVEDLNEHMKLHHVSNGAMLKVKFQCETCSQEFTTYEALQLHKDSVHAYKSDMYAKPELVYAPKTDNHYGNATNDVFIKSEVSFSKNDFINSKSVMHCSVCNLGFSSLGMLSEHIMSSHGINLSTKSPSPGVSSIGSTGGKRGSDGTPRQSPMVSQSPKLNRPPSNASSSGAGIGDYSSWSCELCNAAFTDVRTFQNHMKMHAEGGHPGKFVCSHCSARFPSEELLENHIFIHYLSQTTEYGCTSCMKLFAKPDELQKHLMDIHAHHLYRCALCKEVFDSKVNVQVHFAIKHSNECQLFKCTNCGSVFRSEMEWQLHVKVQHLGISKPYRCLFCKESFSSDVDLQCHLTSHKKPFACPLCDQAFHVEYLLDKHIQTSHSPEADKSMKPSPRPMKEELHEALDFSYSSNDKINQQVSPAVNHTDGAAAAMMTSPGSSRMSRSPPVLKKGDLIHKCDICDVKFSDDLSLQKHRIHDHSISPEMNLIMQKSQQQQISPNVPTLSSPDKFSQLCVYCNQTFKSKSELEKHMKSHVTPSSQKCNICDEVFPSPSILAEHKLQHCKIIKGNVCVVCKVSMKNEEQFYSHAQQHGYQGTSMQCIICRQTLSSMLELQMHGKHHFQGSTAYHTCCVCLKSFSTKENLISKLNTSGRSYYVCKPCYHGEGVQEFRCATCGVKFETQSQLDAHSIQHKKTYQCIKCQQSFATEYEIQVHVATHVIQEGNIHECKMCNSHFDSPAKLQAHLIEHTYENSSEMRCLICQSLFTHVSAIQMHVLEHGLAARQYSCSQCHQKFFFSAELQNHLLSHIPMPRSSQELRCPDCNKTFTNVVTLNTHRRCHDNKDSNSSRCSICALTFNNMAQLQQHFFSVHTSEPGENSNPDSVTGGATSNERVKRSPRSDISEKTANHRNNNTGKENRKGQAKAHHSPKPVPCMICGKTFAKKSLVKEHMKIHFAQANIFQCDYCSETFNQASLLQSHLEEIHNKSESTSLQCTVTCHVCSEEVLALSLTSHLVQSHGITKTEPVDNYKPSEMEIDSIEVKKEMDTHSLQNGNSHDDKMDILNADCRRSVSSSPQTKFAALNGNLEGVTVLSNPSEQVSVN